VTPNMTVRCATTEDSAAIASIMRRASTATLRRITVIGCVGLEAYIHDQIQSRSANYYHVATEGDRIIGMSAWRCEGEYLFLNHLFVLPSEQGRRVGSTLWFHGINHLTVDRTRYLALDVEENSRLAKSWYQALGMNVVSQQTLMEVPLIAPKTTIYGDWSSTFLGASDPDYVRYGFSQFTLTTDRMTYTLGRLGRSLFRATPWAILDDDAALSALHVLDNNRALLCIGTPQGLTSAVRRRGIVLGQTERLTAPLEALTDRLRSAASSPGR
jgi:ribosomal protein S18 acetylase RimI-like enzyme